MATKSHELKDVTFRFVKQKVSKNEARRRLIEGVAAQLRRLLAESKVTQKELARRMGVTPSCVNQIVKGKNITIRTAALAFGALGATMRFDAQP